MVPSPEGAVANSQGREPLSIGWNQTRNKNPRLRKDDTSRSVAPSGLGLDGATPGPGAHAPGYWLPAPSGLKTPNRYNPLQSALKYTSAKDRPLLRLRVCHARAERHCRHPVRCLHQCIDRPDPLRGERLLRGFALRLHFMVRHSHRGHRLRFVAALGYYFGARFIGHKPSPLLLANMLVVSALTYFLVNFLIYCVLRAANDRLAQQQSFLVFLDASIREASMTIHSRSSKAVETGQLGWWGYGLAALQIIGFAVGGLIVFAMLTVIPFCEDCARYFSRVGWQSRYFADPEEFHRTSQEIARLCADKQCQEALDLHADCGELKAKKGCKLCTTMTLRQCHGCAVYWLGFTATQQQGNGWQEVAGSAFHRLHDDDLELP